MPMPRLRPYAEATGRVPTLDIDPLADWENDDEFQIGSPVPHDAIDPEPPASARYPAMDALKAAIDAETKHRGARPQPANYRPNIWQRLAAGAANFGAGYVNAGRRTRVDPDALQGLNETLLRPGYSRAVEEWQRDHAPMEAGVEGATRAAQIEAQEARLSTDAARARAYESAQQAAEQLRRKQAQKLDAPADPWMNLGGAALNRNTKEIIAPPKSPGKVAETLDQTYANRSQISGPLVAKGVITKEQAAVFDLTGRIPPLPKAKGGAGKPRVGTPGQSAKVESDTDRAYAKAEAEFAKVQAKEESLPPEMRNGPEYKAALARLNQKKNQIAQSYATQVKALGGSAEAVKYAMPLTEDEVRKAAIAARKNPDQAVAVMKSKGLL